MRVSKYRHLRRIRFKDKYEKHLVNLCKGHRGYPEPAWYDPDKERYIRIYRGNHGSGRYGYYKKYSHRRVRQFNGELPKNGNGSNKVFDYWWTVD